MKALLNKSWLVHLLWSIPVAVGVWAAMKPYEGAPHPVYSRALDEPRFGLSRKAREKIWRDIARYDQRWKDIAQRDFPDHDWSRHDHYAAHLSQHVTMLAKREDLTQAQIYLIYDEGLSSRWPAPDGKPLDATWVPLEPRQR